MHYFNFNQKLFELGQDSTLGVLTWGLSSLGPLSYRTIMARVADGFQANPPASVQAAADAFTDVFWNEFEAFTLVQRVRALNSKQPFGSAPQALGVRTEAEEGEFDSLRSGLGVGFCVAGYVLPNRAPSAVSIFFDPLASTKPASQSIPGEGSQWWGVPNIVNRLIHGADGNLKNAILVSGKWSGTSQELDHVVATQSLTAASLPIRDAIDYVYSCIHCTIKALKFSSLPQICGGPIELAVITTDRKFRWVRHKPFDAAINDGDCND
ncbi:hypothetical protein SNK19_13025 [Ralstonia pseudosolanacearum]|uniref:hypothetical protein n=1 Tax=Ralstonia pseudosolanacearum TaxID=1310165 RepID=UPI00336A56CE